MHSKGSCHCGKIAFEVEGRPEQVMECNCSICSRKGALLWFVPRDKLRLLTSEADMSTYTFNKHVIKHRFCPTCGIHPFGEGVDPKGNRMAATMCAASKTSTSRLCLPNSSTESHSERSTKARERRASATKTLQIKVKPKTRASLLQQTPDGAWLAHLKSPPVDGRANEELVALVAHHFGVRKAQVSIKSGASRVKLVQIAHS